MILLTSSGPGRLPRGGSKSDEHQRRKCRQQGGAPEGTDEALPEPEPGLSGKQARNEDGHTKRSTEGACPHDERIDDENRQGLGLGEAVQGHETEERGDDPHAKDEGRHHQRDTRQESPRRPWVAGREVQIVTFRSRKALAMTVTELRLMAAAAIMGESTRPKTGYRAPAAMGIPMAL